MRSTVGHWVIRFCPTLAPLWDSRWSGSKVLTGNSQGGVPDRALEISLRDKANSEQKDSRHPVEFAGQILIRSISPSVTWSRVLS